MTRPSAVEAVPPQAAAPPPRAQRVGPAGAVVAVLAFAGMVAWWATVDGASPDGVQLEVVEQRDLTVLHQEPIELGDTFTLEHTHSVTRRTVRETFSVQEGPLVAIEELWFDEPGPNLPSGPEPLGDGMTTFLREGEQFRVLHDSYPIGEVPLLVGSEDVDHVLNFPTGERIRLLDVAPRGAPVVLRAREPSSDG